MLPLHARSSTNLVSSLPMNQQAILTQKSSAEIVDLFQKLNIQRRDRTFLPPTITIFYTGFARRIRIENGKVAES